MMFVFLPPVLQASPDSQPEKPYQTLLEAIAPLDAREGNPAGLKEKRGKLRAAMLLIEAKIEELEKAQKITVQDLRNHRPQMEKDLQVPEVAALRGLIDDPAFLAATEDYDKQVETFLAKSTSDLDDERRWMSQMGIFFRESAQATLNDTGRPFETTTVQIPSTRPSDATLKRIQEGYLPIWERFSRAFEEYESRTDKAVDAARHAAPGSTTEAAARAIDIRILRRLYLSALLELKLILP